MNRGQPLPLLRALALWVVYAALIAAAAVYGMIAKQQGRRGIRDARSTRAAG